MTNDKYDGIKEETLKSIEKHLREYTDKNDEYFFF